MIRFGRGSRCVAGLMVVGALAAGGLMTSGAAGADPGTNLNKDPNDVGTLAFYNTAGTQIYSGLTTDQPFAAFVAGSKAPASTDTGAALYAYLPNASAAAGDWSGELLSSATAYPNASAPTALASTAPLQTGKAGDTSLADFITAFPNKSTATGYSNVYELRLHTSGPGNTASTTYDATEIEVTGTSWHVVYPSAQVTTTTSLTATPSTGLKVGDSVTLAATVDVAGSPVTDAKGTIKFAEGSTALGSVATTNGAASETVTVPHAGTTSFTATYVPDSSSTYSQSTGTQAVTVAKATTKTTATWPTGALHYGTKFTVKASVTAPGIKPTGTVAVKSGSKTVGSATLKSGAATITVSGTALAPGKHSLTVAYAGSADAVASTSAAKSLTIAKATSKTTNSVSPAKVKTTKQAKLSVTVKATGVTPAGAISVFDGSKKIASGKLSKGKASITLPKLKAGKHKLHAVYAGSTTVAGSTGAAVTLTVTK